MLEFIRDRAQGWFAWAIVILLIVPFALWGVNEYMSPEVTVNVAVVDGKEISANEFQQTYQQQRARLQQMLGRNFDPAMFDDAGMKTDVLEGMIEREVLLQNAAKSGMYASDARVGSEIRSIPAVQNDGQFDKELYNRLLSSQGLSIKGFEQLVRNDVLVQQLRSGIAETSFVTQSEVDALLRLRDQRRDVGYLIVPVAQYLGQISIDDQAVAQYYKDNQAQFRTLEQVSVDYLELSVNDLAAATQPVTEADLHQRYEEHKTEFTVPEERRARHILIQAGSDAKQADIDNARAKAGEILARVRKGEDFAALAREFSQDPGSVNNGGDLGSFGRGTMDKAFEDAAFALKPGEVSEPVRSAFGFHIIKLDEIKGGQGKSFEEVRPQLERDLKRQRAEEQYFAQAEQLSNLAFENSDNLQTASKALNLPIRSTALFTRDNGEGIAANPKVRNAAFADDVLNAGHNSEPIELAPDHVVVLRVKEHKPESVRPFEEVRNDIQSKLRIDAAKKKTQETGQAIISQIGKGADVMSAAKEANLTWERPGMIGRSAANVAPMLAEQAFMLDRPSAGKPVLGSVSLPSGDFAVIAIYDVKDGDPTSADEQTKTSARELLSRSRAEDEFQSYVKDLKAEAKIKRYPDKM